VRIARRLSAALAAAALALTACGTDQPASAPEAGEDTDGAFPVTVTDALGQVTIDAVPERIVSLSATHTEILFAIGASDQVVAVDSTSNHPEEAPITDLSAYEPNVEAVAGYEPDLVVIAFDPGDLADGLEAVGVDVLFLDAVTKIEDAYAQWGVLGAATGNADGAAELIADTRAAIDEILAGAPDATGITYFHELDDTPYTATSSTFIGDVYGLFGLTNIADPAGQEAATDFPAVSAEFVIDADPDIIFLADAVYGQTPDVVAARPGWDTITAVANGNLFELDPDLSSRWGPRIVEFVAFVADAVAQAVDEV
jgi:iron complex transport system substrate-binding protein